MAANGAATAAMAQIDYSHKPSDVSGHTEINNWAAPGPAAFDFRSDVMTTPTPSMLAAIASCTLLDDVFIEDPTTMRLESLVAELTGHPAALLVLSGTMGNQLALRTHLGAPPHSVLCDHRSHIVVYEAGGVASLSGAMVTAVEPKNGHHLTLEEVQRRAIVSDDVHACPTKIISLENTLNGMVMPLEEARKISQWARAQDPPIIMHLDGARIWEAVSAGAGTMQEYCSLFDSISLCFSKGLGAPIGSIIVGSEKFIKRARWVRKSIGGGLRQAGVIAAPAHVAVQETFLGGKLAASHVMAKKVEKMWVDMGGKLANPVETNMVWLDVDHECIGKDELIALGSKHGVRLLGGRLVVHYQIGDEGVERLRGMMVELLQLGKERRQVNGVNGH